MEALRFRDLQKAAKKNIEGKPVKIAVLGNCATQFFSEAVKGYAKHEGINACVLDTDYNQIDAQLLDNDSEIYGFAPDFIILWLASDKLYEEFLDSDSEDRNFFAEVVIKKVTRYWEIIQSNTQARIIQPNFTEIPDRVLGNYSAKLEISFTYQLRKLNFLLQEAMLKDKGVFPLDLATIQVELGMNEFYDAPLYYNAKMTIAINTLPYIAKNAVDIILAMQGKIKKCVICDLDNTLWGGVIGDDGLGGIQIGELGQGHAFTNLQRWLKQLKQSGIILAVCSKNNEETAKEPFEQLDEMVLKLEDFSAFVANWNDKATNIKMIQESLNIGMDSIVFIDDNPFERNLVKQLLPDITVPELPKDPALYLEYLVNQNYFENISYVKDAENRTKQYQAEFERKKLQSTIESFDDYLISLDMIGVAKPFSANWYPRIAQLTQRSNQFNLRTVRYTEEDIERFANDDKFITLYYTLKDCFGDHGLVSVVILEKVNAEEVFVDTWLMSCRVLKRGMEEFIINELVDVAKKQGFKKISAEYIPTPKNKMVENIYEDMGFKVKTPHHYELVIDSYKKLNTHITLE